MTRSAITCGSNRASLAYSSSWLILFVRRPGYFPKNTAREGRVEEGRLTPARAAMRIQITRTQPHFRKFRHRLRDVVHQHAQVMQSFPVLCQVLLKRVLRCERLDELKVDIAEVQVGEPHLRVFHHFAQDHGQTEDVPVKLQRFVRVPDHNRDVIELLEHAPTMGRRSEIHKPASQR